VYKRAFSRAYDDPKAAMLNVGREMGLGGRGPRYFKVEGPKDEPPYETNYSKVAEQLRQELIRRDLSPRGAQGHGSGKLVGHGIVGDLIKDLALVEALESHEQQGKRFIRAHRPVVETGFPKSTRSQGEPVEEPLFEERE